VFVFKSQMDKFFIEKAKSELREDDSRREQALEQFRGRISKHTFLSNCRQGERVIIEFYTRDKFVFSLTLSVNR
jgi:hypothetical protein